jgi:hypothetical protein
MTLDDAEENLRRAIIDHALALDAADPNVEMLNEYAIVAHWQPIEDDDGHSRYTTQFHREHIPAHTAVGLFRMGERFLSGGDEE